jgi:hypothetical protein
MFEYSDELNSWLAGFEFNWQVTRPFCFRIGVEVPINLIAAEPMIVNPNYWLLSKFYTGFVYSFDN